MPDDHREGGAGVDAEDARVGQRVAGQALHERAGEAEGGADGEAEEGALHPGLDDGCSGCAASQTASSGTARAPTSSDEHAGTGQHRDRRSRRWPAGRVGAPGLPPEPGDVGPRRDEGGHCSPSTAFDHVGQEVARR